MNVLMLLTRADEPLAPHTKQRPLALLPVSGQPLVTQSLLMMQPVLDDGVTIVARRDADAIQTAVQARFPELVVEAVTDDTAVTPVAALKIASAALTAETSVLVAFGEAVVRTAYDVLPDPDVDCVCVVDPAETSGPFGTAVLAGDGQTVTALASSDSQPESGCALCGVFWFRNGRHLNHLLQDLPKTADTPLLGQRLLEQGGTIRAQAVGIGLYVIDRSSWQYTNARMLSLGYGSEDAIDRSYGEDFTVFPPVFIDETAVVDGCVIGPYVSIGANSIIKNSIVRHSIIDRDVRIQDSVLDGAFIGAEAVVHGKAQAFILGDGAHIDSD